MHRVLLSTGIVLSFFGASFWLVARTSADEPAEIKHSPVEADMHEFMEYVCEPPYKRLKAAMANPTPDNAVWKSVKSDALILAESGNLLIGRPPEKEAAEWLKLAASVRDSGGALYRAAKKKDPAEAHKQWELMLHNCNSCHKQFAGGEHQLTP